jgi:hypothetical protein
MRNGLVMPSSFDMGFSRAYQRSSFCQRLRPDPFFCTHIFSFSQHRKMLGFIAFAPTYAGYYPGAA